VDERKTDDSVRVIDNYIIGEMLGKGGFSWVKMGFDRNTKTPVALKFMLRADKEHQEKQSKRIHTEIHCMIRINNPHVIKLFSYNLHCKYPEKSGGKLNTVMLALEHCSGGELFDILYYTNKLDTVTARTYFFQMMQGLEACHNVGIVHRDIKLQNLLLDSNYQLKIGDFGLSSISKENKALDDTRVTGPCVGTSGYVAPELLRGEKYSKACDIFSCGVVLFILLTGFPPFKEARRSDRHLWANCPKKF